MVVDTTDLAPEPGVMLGTMASVALTVALVPVVVWCASCLVRRARHDVDDPVPVDVEAWHAVMGVAMVVMLWIPLSRDWAWVAAAGFAVMTAICVRRLRGHEARGWYRRLGVMGLAMAAMLAPAGAASAAAPTMDMGTGTDTGGMPMGETGGGHGSVMLLSGTGAVVVAIAVAVVGFAALRLALRSSSRSTRLSACCEVVAAAAMGVMALALV